MKEKITEIINNDRYIKISDTLYFIGIIVFTLKFFMEKWTWLTINDNIFAIILCFCFAQRMIFQKYSKKQLIITIISGFISAYVGFATKEYVLFYLYLSIFASKNIELQKIIKISFYVIFILLGICTVAYTINYLIGNEVPITYRNDGSVRYAFYLNHPNMYAGIVLWLSAMVLYLKYDTINIKYYAVIIGINIVTYILTDSRTSFFAFVLLMILYYASKAIKGENKFYKAIAKYSAIVICIITILSSEIYLLDKNNYVISKLNEFFSQRVFLLSSAIEKFGISVWPRNLDLTEKIRWESGAIRELYIDSIYARAFIKYGLVYLLYYLYLCTSLINKNTGNKEIPFVILFEIIGMMEKYIIFPTIAFPMFFYKMIIWDEKETKNRGEKIE